MFIDNVKIKGRAVLAPMAGVTDQAYREICMRMGAAYSVTEMVSAKAVQYNYRKSSEIAALSDSVRPAAIQIFGDDPVVMALSAKKLMEYSPDIIDINMGCPMPKVAGNNSGAALMRRPDLCGAIVASIKKSVEVPVTVKIRSGWDENSINAVEVAQACEAGGAAAVTIHGRTRAQMYTGHADWGIIRQVKQSVKIPVIGSGDVDSPQSAAAMLEETGCDLVMVGRAAQGNPWLFREINAWLEHEVLLPAPVLSERIAMIKRHITALCQDKGEDRGMREARKHVAWYLHGMRGAADFRRRAGELKTMEDLDLLMKDVYTENLEEKIELTEQGA